MLVGEAGDAVLAKTIDITTFQPATPRQKMPTSCGSAPDSLELVRDDSEPRPEQGHGLRKSIRVDCTER
jgi:hypothetical protein